MPSNLADQMCPCKTNSSHEQPLWWGSGQPTSITKMIRWATSRLGVGGMARARSLLDSSNSIPPTSSSPPELSTQCRSLASQSASRRTKKADGKLNISKVADSKLYSTNISKHKTTAFTRIGSLTGVEYARNWSSRKESRISARIQIWKNII